MGNLKVQGHLLVEASNHSYGGLRVINTQTAVAESSMTFWQAGESAWGIGAGCYAAGSLFTICSAAADRNLLTMDPNTGNTYLYGNLKIRRLDKNTAPTAFMTFINNDSANGMAYSLLEDVTVTKTGGGASGTWNIGITGNAATATTATKANYPTGFTGKCSESAWGTISSDDYTFITGWYSGSGNYGAVDFLHYPNSTQITMKIDGFVYQNEGLYRCLDTSGGTISNSIGVNNHNGILQIQNTNSISSGFHSPLRVIAPNAKGTQCIMIGPANSDKNAGYLGFYNTGTSSSNSNYLTLGLYALDNAINIFGGGKIGFWTTAPSQNFSFYSKYNNTGCVADFWSSAENGSYIYFGGDKCGSGYKASMGYYQGLACLANEATYTRIGVTDAGKPNFWTSPTSGKYELIVGNGYHNVGPIKLTPGSGANSCSNNYISAGRGYSTGSGLHGIKLVATEQDDAISGIGQDCMGKAYELSVCAAQGTDNTAFITFCAHKIASPKSYSELGFFDGKANAFKLNGLFAVGTGSYGALSARPAGSYAGQVYFAI